MKKLMLIIAASAAFTTASEAANIAWGTSIVKFDGVAVTSGLTSYLVYLGSSSTISDYTPLSENTEYTSIISGIGSNTGSTGTVATSGFSKGKVSGSYDNLPSSVHDGDYFAVLLAYTKDGKTYYNLSEASAASYNSGAQDWSSLSISGWDFSTKGESSTLSAKGGWTYGPASQEPITPEVPEPATGALALAGVALLFKRRRA